MSNRLILSGIGICAFAIAAGLIFHAAHTHKETNPTANSPTTPQISYSTYVNARFAYSVCYPPQILVPQGESTDGDGQKFVSHDGQATVSVYGTNNALKQNLQQVLGQDSKGITLSDRALTTGVFRFSGKSSSSVTVMEETFSRDQEFKTLNIQFPASEAATYAPIAERMIACFANTTPTEYSQ